MKAWLRKSSPSVLSADACGEITDGARCRLESGPVWRHRRANPTGRKPTQWLARLLVTCCARGSVPTVGAVGRHTALPNYSIFNVPGWRNQQRQGPKNATDPWAFLRVSRLRPRLGGGAAMHNKVR